MDKNFIKIDDLVRQRLTGVEEKEKSGAWMNMRDLLDKEMPQQKRISIFYWRRIFSAVAVLSLLGSVCIGGIELSSYYNNSDKETPNTTTLVAAGNDNAALLVSEGKADDVHSSSGENVTATGKTIAANVVASSAATSHSAKDAQNVAPSHNGDVTTSNAVVNNAGTATDAKGKQANRKSAENVTPVRNSVVSTDNTTPASKEIATPTGENVSGKPQNSSHVIANTNPKNVSQPINKIPSASTKTTASNNNTTKNNNHNNSSSIAHINKPLGNNSFAIANNGASTLAKEVTANNTAAVVATGSNAVAAADTRNTTLPASQKEAKLDVLNSSAPTTATPATAVGKETASTDFSTKITDNKATTTPINVSSTANKSGNTTPATVATTTNNATQPATVATRTAKGNKGDKATDKIKGNNFTASTGGLAPKPQTDENNNKPKRVITKIQVHQRTIMLASNVYGNRIDTISIEKVNVDLGLNTHAKNNNEDDVVVAKAKNNQDTDNEATENKPASHRSHKTGRHSATPGTMTNGNQRTLAPAAKAGKGANSANSNDPSALSANQPEHSNGTDEDTQEELLPGATASNESAPESAAKNAEVAATTTAAPKAAQQEHKGLSMIKKMSLAFNDVKESASRAHLVGGITAGINSNFFGPNSFKGFQFGLTANLVFNDTWNIMTEMKYFHRLNNNKSIEDNYYTYTPTSNNQYSKQLLLNSYSFSALHSIEMPVAIKYTKGKFNFYSGGNFIYSFSINTGAETLPTYNVAPVLVNEIGPDNAPKLKDEDFRSRFGIGYLFGFSYRLAPNANLDFRTVQTIWDNSNSAGARAVSGQLYRAPSLQLSIMYRLGGNRNSD